MNIPTIIFSYLSYSIVVAGTLCIIATPFFAAAQETTATSTGFARDGVFGCRGGLSAIADGQFGPAGGPYVPVSDQAVTENTGHIVRNTSHLVYKECVLDGVVVATREAATANLTKNMMDWFNEGNAGNPHFVANWDQHFLNISDAETIEFLKDYRMDSVCSPFRQQVRGNLAKQYLIQTGRDETQKESFSCTFPESQNLESFIAGDWNQGGWDSFFEVVSNPSNQPYGAFLQAEAQLTTERARERQRELNELAWGQGALPVVRYREEPTSSGDPRRIREVVTPGFLVAALIEQGATTGFRQLESANEVGHIITSTFASLGNQVLTSPQGLTGISQSPGGGLPSFLDQVIQITSGNLGDVAAGAALDILINWFNLQSQFNEYMQDAKDSITTAMAQLRSAERQCWEFIEEAVQEASENQEACHTDPTGTQVCTPLPPVPFTVATTTEFSTQAIEDHLVDLDEDADENIEDAEVAIELIQVLIDALNNNDSPSAQDQALRQLDQLVVSGAVRTDFDVAQAEVHSQTIANTTNSIVNSVLDEWTEDDGWCNVTNDAVVNDWLDEWRDN